MWRRSGRGGSELDRHRLMFRTGVRPWLELPSGSSETSTGNCRETGTGRVRACHTPRHPLQNHPSGHLGRWATPWPAEEMLDGQRQRADSPARARAAHKASCRRDQRRICAESSLLSPELKSLLAQWSIIFAVAASDRTGRPVRSDEDDSQI